MVFFTRAEWEILGGNVTCWIWVGIFPTPLYPRIRHLLNLDWNCSHPLYTPGSVTGAEVEFRGLNGCKIAEVLDDGYIRVEVPELGRYRAGPGKWSLKAVEPLLDLMI